jgi:hypothetical protein
VSAGMRHGMLYKSTHAPHEWRLAGEESHLDEAQYDMRTGGKVKLTHAPPTWKHDCADSAGQELYHASSVGTELAKHARCEH